ncbi:hypothetical protein [Hymenobacter tenuis]
MNKILLIVLLCILASCHQETGKSKYLSPEPVKNVIVNLTDSLGHLGKISLDLPTRYDTAFNWRNYYGCDGGFDFRYRVQPKNKYIIRENAFFWVIPSDSIERFTIKHQGLYEIRKSDSCRIFTYHALNKKEIIARGRGALNSKNFSDTIERINSNYYSIFTYKIPDSTNHKLLQKIEARTIKKGVIIDLEFELNIPKEDSLAKHFISNSKYYLRTVKISD